ncbi:DMT family transporter [Sporomusa acidovorans]|uniref:EamA domain-containing protein n=1 Tax=Sporomusa acidovorans (strain ATCC 49682 / DSM 3132 / Mol) TaxID=1123286 RepID=A0ABZ3J8K6_SPOA4|nr:DMT family transporter [Sporomusa acidovorans]OZC16670.1 putative inner membrane transporter YedA [Sporomusa acidovorans DSM 3132]SDE06780.1 Permease of the drug/metabolite transporter (DMT) superfamily [Sporomusa acidovorans]
MRENMGEMQTNTGLGDKKYILANLLMAVTILFWGISYVSIKITVTEVPPVTMAAIRFIIASVLLWGLLKRLEPEAKLAKADRLPMALAGCLGITLYFYFENIGVKLTTAANASLIVTIIPILAIGLDILFFGARVSVLKLVGIAIAIVGTYFSVTANGELDLKSANFVGNLLVVGAMLSWTFYTLASRSLQKKYSGMCMTTYQTIIGTALLIPLALTERNEWHAFSLQAWGHILFLSVCCSVLGYLFYMYVLKQLDVAITTLYLNLVPVVGVISGYFILGENVLPIQMAGGALTLLAIVVMNFEKARQKNMEEDAVKEV